MQTDTTRRALIGSAGIAAVLATAPALATSAHTGSAAFRALLDHADSASARFNALPNELEVENHNAWAAEQERMLSASRAADLAIPTSWAEFVRLFEHMSDNGFSAVDDDNAERLLAHARRLAKQEG